ncbi:GNAT family N-acetyltransferase [Salipiger sp. PrR007]|uniref:GNAT family N-acetyltransferase n=1 Tax=Salipiger sp. PrR007 TaxID=2706884 RepID=UPI0013B67F7F|nr:GNAT family N-acetyltransferase [Salipiger sp. PrR007]NDW32099.1 GNAT family N-acetyltransferase [Salipiger sp. PrR007]
MAELLNEIIAQGGTTAMTQPVSGEDLRHWMGTPRAVWHVAEDEADTVAQIATFARVGRTGLGIGSALFEATRAACRDEAYAWINAEIRADNEGGLIYYQSRGFEDYGTIRNYLLGDGGTVDKVLKRYDL